MIDTELDFKLLSVFRALFEKQQVSAAADHLGISQPSVSRCLAKLRKHFNDPLFVRTQYKMEPTPRAAELVTAIDEMYEIYRTKLLSQPSFDPASSTRSFRVAGSEVAHVLLFSHLIPRIFKEAPGVQLNAIPLGVNTLARDLESGEANLAFGAFPKLYASIYERVLYTERYICIVRDDHPTIRRKMTINDFINSNHIIVSTHRLGHIHGQIEGVITEAFSDTKIKVITHNFLTACLLAEKMDAIVTVPSGAALALNHRKKLRLFEPPIALPTFEVKQYWHERHHRDPGHVWLRNLINEAFKDVDFILDPDFT